MHFDDFGKLFSSIIRVFTKFIKDETQHPVGKIDLGFVILFSAMFIGGFFIDEAILFYKVIANRHINEMEFFAQPIMFVCIMIFGYFSLKLIPPKSPRRH
jgi:hypothetical protein